MIGNFRDDILSAEYLAEGPRSVSCCQIPVLADYRVDTVMSSPAPCRGLQSIEDTFEGIELLSCFRKLPRSGQTLIILNVLIGVGDERVEVRRKLRGIGRG